MKLENKKIADAIKLFTHGKYREKKPYLADLRTTEGAYYNGFTFNKEVYCWVVWKATDIETEPEYKGEPLYKVIPDNVPIDKIPAVLDAQPWTYA